MPARRVLVIEDDPAIRRGVVDALQFDGYQPLEAGTFQEGLEAALRAPCELVLLDLVLPGGDGLDILARAREAHPTLPVIVLTARGAEHDRVLGLRRGADDYVLKPFSAKELLARVEAVLRRSAERRADVEEIAFEGGRAHLGRREVALDGGGTAQLSEREAELLGYLARAAGRPVSREELLERVWRVPARSVHTRTVDMHVARLREKLGDPAENPRVILTLRGKGYRLVPRA
ncbi:MAG TPA: response regulator transcription factor [Anaeromyxobacter sp.]|nr:response regulator transcription factor [Anaeromyxobacter sp.]